LRAGAARADDPAYAPVKLRATPMPQASE